MNSKGGASCPIDPLLDATARTNLEGALTIDPGVLGAEESPGDRELSYRVYTPYRAEAGREMTNASFEKRDLYLF